MFGLFRDARASDKRSANIVSVNHEATFTFYVFSF